MVNGAYNEIDQNLITKDIVTYVCNHNKNSAACQSKLSTDLVKTQIMFDIIDL